MSIIMATVAQLLRQRAIYTVIGRLIGTLLMVCWTLPMYAIAAALTLAVIIASALVAVPTTEMLTFNLCRRSADLTTEDVKPYKP